jgi:hypothetical protein
MRNVTRAFLGLAAGVLAFGASAATAATLFAGPLSGDQEVPPTGEPGDGSRFVLTIPDPAAPSLVFDILISNLYNFGLEGSVGDRLVSALHFHGPASRGENAGVIFGLLNPSHDADSDTTFTVNADGTTTIAGEWDTDEGPTPFADVAQMFLVAERGHDVPFYLNLHTADFPGGAIRGQVVAAIPLPASVFMLGGALALMAFGRAAARRG